MNNLLNELYDAIYSPKITPQELLQNLNVENYTAVNFHKKGNYLIAYTFCTVEDEKNAKFIYTFDEKDHLLTLESEIDREKQEIYNRKEDIKKKYKELTSILKDKRSIKAV